VTRTLAAFAFAIACAGAAGAADRATFSGSFAVTLNAPADRALPLFDPIGEARWAKGWSPIFAREADRMSLPEGSVFTTGHGETATTWVLQRYDRRAHEIVYTAFHSEGVVVSIRIALQDRAPGASEASVRYDLVATNEAGDRSVRDFASTFPHQRAHWQSALDAAPLP
jgi:hypothetical protein